MSDPMDPPPAPTTAQPVTHSDLPSMPEGTTTSAAPAGFGRRLSARVIDILVTWYGITLGALVILAGMLALPVRNRPAHLSQLLHGASPGTCFPVKRLDARPRRRSAMRFLLLRSLSIVGCLTALSLMGLTPPAAADGVYHSEHIELIPIGGAPLRSGFVENIHVNGPEIFALERYVLSGASPNITYQVTLHIGDTSCATTPLVLQSVAFQTNLAGNGVGELSLPPSAIPPSSHGLTFGVVWELTNGTTLAYETACSIVTLD